MVAPFPLPELAYSQARPLIRSGDLLLFRARSLPGRVIAAAGRGSYSHAAMAVWWGRPTEAPDRDDYGILLAVETREWRGGRVVPLSRCVREHRGAIDVFAVNAPSRHYDRWGACEWMLREVPGVRYGWRGLLRLAVSHMPGLRWLLRPSRDDLSRPRDKPVCSTAVAMAARIGGGVDPVPQLADDWCEPSDLAKSLLFRRKLRLVPD